MDSPNNNSYAPPKSAVADVPVDAGDFELAERGTRLGASIVDGLIFLAAWVPAIIAVLRTANLSALNGQHSPGYGNVMAGAFASAGIWVALAGLINLVLLIVTAVLVHRNAQTIGKKWLGIKVVRTDGSRASLGRIFWMRNVVSALPGILPFIGKIYQLVDALFIFGEAKRCIHDYIADTIVVRA